MATDQVTTSDRSPVPHLHTQLRSDQRQQLVQWCLRRPRVQDSQCAYVLGRDEVVQGAQMLANCQRRPGGDSDDTQPRGAPGNRGLSALYSYEASRHLTLPDE